MPKMCLPNWSLPRNITQKWDWGKILFSNLLDDGDDDDDETKLNISADYFYRWE